MYSLRKSIATVCTCVHYFTYSIDVVGHETTIGYTKGYDLTLLKEDERIGVQIIVR
jgi:hypothetical protein